MVRGADDGVVVIGEEEEEEEEEEEGGDCDGFVLVVDQCGGLLTVVDAAAAAVVDSDVVCGFGRAAVWARKADQKLEKKGRLVFMILPFDVSFGQDLYCIALECCFLL
jgi:hypothetical protein